MDIYQISVFIENKKGRLEDIVRALSDENISIRALSVADTTDFGILRLIVSDTDAAIDALKKRGITASKTRVICVRMADETGALAHILSVLKSADVSVEYAYAFITHTKNDACVVLRVDGHDRAIDALQKGGVELIGKID